MLWTLPGLYTKQMVQRGSKTVAFTTITANATAHTKGAWTEIVAAADYDFDVGLIILRINGNATSGSSTAALVDIGVGAAASEQVLVPNILAGGHDGSNSLGISTYIPIFVPAGTRIAVRCQHTTGGSSFDVSMDLFGGADMASHPLVYHGVENAGADETTSTGVDISGGGWTELIASTAFEFEALVPMFAGGGFGGDANDVRFGIGASTSEVPVLEGAMLETNASESIQQPIPRGFWPMDTRAPAGTRLAAEVVTGGRDIFAGALLMRR